MTYATYPSLKDKVVFGSGSATEKNRAENEEDISPLPESQQ